jgi:hypothetical protein
MAGFSDFISGLVPNELQNFFSSQPARVLDKYRNPDNKSLDPNNVSSGTLDKYGIKFDAGDPYADAAKSEAENALRFGHLNRDIVQGSMQPQDLSWNQMLGGALQKAGGVVSYAQHTPGAEDIFNNTILDKHIADTNQAQKELREAMLKGTLEGTKGAQDAWMKYSQSRLQKRMDARNRALLNYQDGPSPQKAKESADYLRAQGFPQDAADFEKTHAQDVAKTPAMPDAATVGPPQGAAPATPAAPGPVGPPPGPVSGGPAPPAGVTHPPGPGPIGATPSGQPVAPAGLQPPPVPPAAPVPGPQGAAAPPQAPPGPGLPNHVQQLWDSAARESRFGDPKMAEQFRDQAKAEQGRWKLDTIGMDPLTRTPEKGWVDTWGKNDPIPYEAPESPESRKMLDTLVEGIHDGSLSPDLSKSGAGYGRGIKIVSALKEAHPEFSLVQAQREAKAADHLAQSATSPQAVQFFRTVGSAMPLLDHILDLSDKLQQASPELLKRGNFNELNKAAVNWLANNQQNTEAGQLAAKLITDLGALKGESATIESGGYAAHQDAWDIVNKQIGDGSYSVKSLAARLGEIRRVYQYRIDSFQTMGYGPGVANRYAPNGGKIIPLPPHEGDTKQPTGMDEWTSNGDREKLQADPSEKNKAFFRKHYGDDALTRALGGDSGGGAG